MPNPNYRQLHETGLKEIIAKIAADEMSKGREPIITRNNRGPKTYSSIAKATSGLILVFPVLCTRSINAETASMISKAVERRCVSMMQMLFAAHQISSVGDVQSFVDQFHKNIKLNSRYTIDDFIDFMNSVAESCNINVIVDKVALDAIREDMKNLDFYFEEDLDNKSYNEYTVSKSGSLKEGKEVWQDYKNKDYLPDGMVPGSEESERHVRNISQIQNSAINKNKAAAQIALFRKQEDESNQRSTYTKNKDRREENAENREKEKWNIQKPRDEKREQRDIEKHNMEIERDRRQAKKDSIDAMMQQYNLKQQSMKNMLLDNDIKKANELMPTSLLVSFNTVDDAGNPVRMESAILGIKAKLIGVESFDIVNHLVEFNNRNNTLLQLVKATTRETSFVRDFLFAVDKAKIDSLSVSRKGSANPMWKVLEQRANRLRRRRFLNSGNDASAITVLVLSKQAEVDALMNKEDINVLNPRIAGNLLNGYNFMGIIVVDELLEVAHVMWDDGDYSWEDLSFNSLQKENNNNDMKKVINLMTKMR